MTKNSRVDAAWRDGLIIGLVYAFSWGALLVNRGLYWDDWTLSGLSPASLLQGSDEIGMMPWFGKLVAGLFLLPLPGLVGHILVFFAYLLTTLLLHAVLRRTPGLSRMDALVAALTFAVLPVNYARIALVDLNYGLSLVAFLAATWLLVRYLEVGGPARRVASLGLFVLSFSTESLLVLYAMPIALGGFIVWKSAKVPIRSFVPRHVDFLALPVVFWLVKAAFFAPTGVYTGYNAVTLRGLAKVPRAMIPIPYDVLFEPLHRAALVAGLLGLVVGAGTAVWLLRRSRNEEQGSLVSAPILALIGVAALGLGVFPYLAVGKVPTIWDWSSRHQLLVPIGAGLMAAAAIRGVRGAGRAGPVIGVAVGLMLGMSAIADVRTLVAYQLDWFKQVALMDAARTIPAIGTARHIAIVDSSGSLNAMRRTYRFYEYNALFSAALGDTRRLISDAKSEPAAADVASYIPRQAYHMGEYVPSPVDLQLGVAAAGGRPGWQQVLRLVVLEATGSSAFETEASRLITVTASPVAAAAGRGSCVSRCFSRPQDVVAGGDATRSTPSAASDVVTIGCAERRPTGSPAMFGPPNPAC